MDGQPLAGPDLLSRLRGEGIERPLIDPALASRLRTVLEQGVASPAEHLPEDVTVRVTKTRLRQAQACERHLVARLVESGTPSPELVQGQLLDRVFTHVAAGFPPGPDPAADALAVAAVEGDLTLIAAWDGLNQDEQLEVADLCRAVATSLAGRWPALPANALPRLQEPVRIALARGRVVLSGRLDVVLGRPAADRAGTTLIDVKSGRRRYEDTLDAAWYAVLETLRHGAAPFQSGNYYLRDGILEVEVVEPADLELAAARIADAAARIVRIAAGQAATMTPNGLCPWCPALDDCEPGRRHAEERAGGGEGRWEGIEDEDDDGEF